MAISPDPHSQVARLATLTPGASAWMFGATIHPGDGRTDSDIEMLQRLHPSAMAHVLDMSPRAFRDRVDIPRNPDGTCNARDVTRALRDDAEEHFVTRLVR
ncbi:MAG TPA: hypothetical protein P5307_24640, partial [Pirellulaceae bacterium]|nr:hypothetical protein [Pirellulaceae bacterium]